jgi:hypothetical protein
MKIRTGFVSNSSSSSFCLYGVFLEDGDSLKEIFKNIQATENYELIEEITSLASHLGLEVECPDGFNGVYIGRSFEGIGDNETGKQFKDSTKDKIRILTGKNLDCSTYSESWYNG